MVISPFDYESFELTRCSIQAARPFIDVALGLIALFAVDLLELAYELFALALDKIPVVVGELSPPLLCLTFELLPLASYAIPIHDRSSL
jgi:hypothetical protein